MLVLNLNGQTDQLIETFLHPTGYSKNVATHYAQFSTLNVYFNKTDTDDNPQD